MWNRRCHQIALSGGVVGSRYLRACLRCRLDDTCELERTVDETIFDDSPDRSDNQTIGDVNLSEFLRHETPLISMGALRPVVSSFNQRTLIDKQAVTIGRDPKSDVPLSTDDSVSRQHARIRPAGAEFILEDLGSSNGTYVDGVPIISCRLHGGDIVQIGRNLFLFDRLMGYSAEADNQDDDES